MALAGAERIFDIIDQKPEIDEGYVMLVNAKINDKGEDPTTRAKTKTKTYKRNKFVQSANKSH